ncbi:MAG TPA: TetR/AcrR family transcriptional regulator [Candidatus Mediterraneibacter vanvlietii]|nr:TetR/AcrR family transcriptional regulator [Candidatus Mediterraneibacter vanvlietii]
MAKQIEGVYESVLACAKKEFLEKGYKDASLRVIAQAAGTSTGSIYTRFKDKAGLFDAIVGPAADQLKDMFVEIQENFHSLDDSTQEAEMGEYTSRHQMEMLEYIYDHFDEFRLLLDCSDGTRFSGFVDELVDIEVEYTYKYMEVINCESVKSGVVTEDFIHIIVTAYFNGMFEVVRHNMSRDDARKYIRLLNRYHMQGFSTVFNPEISE